MKKKYSQDPSVTPAAPEEIPEKQDNPRKEEHEGTEKSCDQAELIERMGQTVSENSKHLIHCLTIIGQIEGHYNAPANTKTTKYEHIMPALVAIEQDRSIEGLLIILNTVGGDVEAGLAIAELISGMKTPTVSVVLGGGHSIGVPLAVSAKISYIVPSATMTIHPVRTTGMVLAVPQSFTYLEAMQKRITDFVCRQSRISSEDFSRLLMNTGELVLDMGTVIDGETAVEIGLIDRLGGLSDAVEALYTLIEESEPRYRD